jgi:hypothetical protein
MWYKIILAKALEETINEMNPEHQEFVKQIQDRRELGIAVNMIRKNPNITIPELTSTIQQNSQKQVAPTNTQQEQVIASAYSQHPDFQNWILLQLRILRRTLSFSDDSKQLYNQEMRQKQREFALIYDWYKFNNIGKNINNYNYEKAEKATAIWHKVIAGEGAGKIYEPTEPDLVVYEFNNNGENPDWEGWTIQEVRTPNDLSCEGNLMNHCVGGYADEVKSGRTRIFSLRDPQNKPHVTLETDNSGTDVKQIKGNSNKTPRDEYKDMIRDWVNSRTNKMRFTGSDYENDDYYPAYETEYAYSIDDPKELGEYLSGAFGAQDKPKEDDDYYDDYGFSYDPSRDDEEVEPSDAYSLAVDVLKKMLGIIKSPEINWRKYTQLHYIQGIEVLVDELSDAAYKHDKMELEDPDAPPITYAKWQNKSFLYDFKNQALSDLNDGMYIDKVEDLDDEEKENLLNIVHKKVQDMTLKNIGTSNPQNMSKELDAYWQKKLGVDSSNYVDPITGEFNQTEFMRVIQSAYREYLNELTQETLTQLQVDEDSGVNGEPKSDFGAAMLQKVNERLRELNPLVLQVTNGSLEEAEAPQREKQTPLF